MKIFNYIIESNFRARHPFTYLKTRKRSRYSPYNQLVWGKLIVNYGPEQYCEECDKPNGLDSICDECQEHYYCECGVRLEDAYGSPGDGFCRRCS